MVDDILFEENTSDLSEDGWIDLDFWMWEESKKEEESPAEEEKKEEESKKEDEVPLDDPKWDDDEELNLDDLFKDLDSELEESNKALDKIEETGADVWEVWLLRDSLKRMEDQIKKLNNNNADLKFRNAELEAFWIDNENPKLLIISRNLNKAIDGDDRSKTKVVTTLKEMLYDLTWEDFDETKVNKDVDLLTATEVYNNETNPNLKGKKEEDDFWIAV